MPGNGEDDMAASLGDEHMARRTIPYEDILYQDLQDPEEAVAYLNAARRIRTGGRGLSLSPP